MKVRALQTIKYGSRWHVPGTPTEIIDAPPEVVERWGGAVELLEPEPSPASVLPDDFPGRKILIGLGHDTIEKVMTIDDLTSLDGIGKKTANAIEDRLGGSG